MAHVAEPQIQRVLRRGVLSCTLSSQMRGARQNLGISQRLNVVSLRPIIIAACCVVILHSVAFCTVLFTVRHAIQMDDGMEAPLLLLLLLRLLVLIILLMLIMLRLIMLLLLLRLMWRLPWRRMYRQMWWRMLWRMLHVRLWRLMLRQQG